MITKIGIQNFKSIENLNLSIPNFSVVVGNNGVGKTNFLKAVKLIALLASGKQIKDVLSRLQLLPKELFFNRENSTINFSIDLLIEGKTIKYSFEITQEQIDGNYSYRISKEFLTDGVSDRPVLQREGDRIDISPGEGSSGVELVNSQLAISILRKPSIIIKVQRVLSSILVGTFEPNSLREFGSVSRVGTELEKNLAESLYSLSSTNKEKYGQIESEAKEMISGLNSIIIGKSDEEGRLVVVFKESDLQQDMTFFSASDGNLRSLGIISSILGEPRPSAVFIDEIENSLHPKRIIALLKFLDYLSRKEKDPLQVIITTHSSVVLDCINSTDIIYMYKQNSVTKVGNPHRDQNVLNYLNRAKKADASLGDLFEEGLLETLYTVPTDE